MFRRCLTTSEEQKYEIDDSDRVLLVCLFHRLFAGCRPDDQRRLDLFRFFWRDQGLLRPVRHLEGTQFFRSLRTARAAASTRDLSFATRRRPALLAYIWTHDEPLNSKKRVGIAFDFVGIVVVILIEVDLD